MKNMVLMARTNEKSYLNNYKGENWAIVKEGTGFYPSGKCKTVTFPSGYKVKADRCELVYVFEK